MNRKDDIVKDIVIRSEEVQEVLGRVPIWLLRSGISLLCVFITILLIGAYLFKYPEVVSSQLILTTITPPAEIVSKTSGKIVEIHVKNQHDIRRGDCLAVIESPALYRDILYLENEIPLILDCIQTGRNHFVINSNLKLGEIQPIFSSMQLALDNYNSFNMINYYPRKINSLKTLIKAYDNQYDNALKQKEITLKQFEINRGIFNRVIRLNSQNLISEDEFDKADNLFLQSQMSVENIQNTLDNLNIQNIQIKDNLVDVEQQYQEKKCALVSELKSIINQLQNSILAWKMTYLLCSPIDGKVTFSNNWSINQNVTIGKTVFTIIPKMRSELMGIAQLPPQRSGKVKLGQLVNVQFVNYPKNEYGMVIGVVTKKSLMPSKGKYTVEVGFPNGLKTTYGIELPLSYEMAATADIVTDDLRLIEQIFLPLKSALKNNL